jgi:hypothetical protein
MRRHGVSSIDRKLESFPFSPQVFSTLYGDLLPSLAIANNTNWNTV